MKHLWIAAAAIAFGTAATAENWTLNGSASHLGFGSVKNSYFGEVHSFAKLSGGVRNGMADIAVALGSVDTMIEIRDERMIEHVFDATPTARISAQIDTETLETLAPGETTIIEVDATLSFLGDDVDVFTEMFVARMTEDRVLVSTNDMLFIATDELGIDGAIDTLQGIAGLDDIARAVPITLRLVFDAAGSSS